MDIRFGGATKVTTVGDGRPHSLIELAQMGKTTGANGLVVEGGLPLKDIESEEVTIHADDSNSSSVKVGPNGASFDPLAKTEGISWRKVDPALVTINDLGVSGLIVYVSWGGPTDRWLANYRNKTSTRR